MGVSGFSCPQVIVYHRVSSLRVNIKIISEPLKPAVKVVTLLSVNASIAHSTQNSQGEATPAENELTKSN